MHYPYKTHTDQLKQFCVANWADGHLVQSIVTFPPLSNIQLFALAAA